MKKLILFDWGNVLLNSYSNDYNINMAQLDMIAELHPKVHDIFLSLFHKKEFWTTNGIQLNRLIEKYLTMSKCNCTVEKFKECYLKYYGQVPYYEHMVDVLNKLVESNCPVGILSTCCEMDMKLMKTKLPIGKLGFRFFSFNLKMEKPDPNVYEIVEIVTDVSPKNIYFIDDRIENIQAAMNRGWNIHHALENLSDKEICRNIELECNEFLLT